MTPGAAAALLAGAALVGLAVPAVAATVDQLTCAVANAQVRATGRYDKRTGFGVVPIIVSRRLAPGQGADCPTGSSVSFNFERTVDNPTCVLGYSCERRDNR